MRDVHYDVHLKVTDEEREEKDRRGGELLVIYRKYKGINLEKVETRSKAIVFVKGKMKRREVKVMLV